MSLKQLTDNLLNDIEKDLTQAFDKNFERKAFFDRKWKGDKYPNSRGSLLLRTGRLRRSIKSNRRGGTINWKSNLAYASIQNEGGELEVTPKMKKFFWAMFYKASGGITFSVKKKAMANTKRNQKLNAEAQKWKNMALMKVGAKMKIEQRQFIGWHPQIDALIKKNVDHHMKEYSKNLVKR